MSIDIMASLQAAADQYEASVLQRHRELRTAEDNSVQKLELIKQHLRENPPPLELGIDVLAVAGSLARREASGLSDIDLIITTKEETDASGTQAIIQWRRELCATLKIDPPNEKGVFHQPISRARVESIAGASDEPYDYTSKRILFLLESAPIYNEDGYEKLIDAIIERYADDVRSDSKKNFVFLLNDVVRYFRLVCVNYQQVKSETPDGKWPLRNIKLRHSRVLMYFSMVSAIGTLSREQGVEKIAALKQLVRMHPLKRLFVAYHLAQDTCFYRVAGLYDTFIALLSNDTTRKALLEVDYDARYNTSVFSQLKANSDAFAAELMRFYDARRGQWDERFFEYMIL